MSLTAQHELSISAELNADEGTLSIIQETVYFNNSDVSLNELYLHDWANSFSSKTTPLGKRFSENYNSSFHFEKNEKRGRTTITGMISASNISLDWERGTEADIIKVNLEKPLAPGERYTFTTLYTVKLPDDKFTRYGVTKENNFNLQYWYLSPAIFNGAWQLYSNKNTEDLYLTPSKFQVVLKTPKTYDLISEFDVVSETISEDKKITTLEGQDRMRAVIYLSKNSKFESVVTDKVEVITDLEDKKVSPAIKALSIDRIVHFLDDKLGAYPFKKMVISEVDYRTCPVYGLNQLPNFISPFPDGFEYDMEQLKTITRNYLENTLALNPRTDHWLTGALQIYMMMEYVDTYYPNMKIIGSLSDFWIIKWSHISDLEFNDQYPLLYLNMARSNLHQSLSTPRDSLVKFNKNIASDYQGGNGLQYLRDYIGPQILNNSIKEFYNSNRLKVVHSSSFEEILTKNTALPVNWFFEDFVGKRSTIDFKIKKVENQGDSLKVWIKNLRETKMPVSIYGLNRDDVVFKKWTKPVDSITEITVPAKDVRKLALNYEGVIPEFNQRNNYKKVKGLLNRPLQFRLFQDVEDPKYNQVFFMPVFEYNLYDGFSVGPKMYNKTLLPKGIHYKLEPQYGFRSTDIIGKGSVVYTQRLDKGKLYSMRYGVSGSYFSYNEGLFYKRLTPFMTFAFRNRDLRNNEKQFINLRSVNVARDDDPSDPDQEPNYSVFNLQYVYSNPNLINHFRGVMDYQISAKFSKISTTFEFRKLFINNRQLNLRFFAGAFLFNDTTNDADFFSFALDRPTDYLFDYNYYGRSEDAGLFSQQLVIAEGGFKSQLEPAFSNSWITTVNASTNIWKWIFAYGDVGLVHNKGEGVQGVYDTGIRLNFLADYFELYLPLYSNLGWEPGLPNYDQKIRFIVTISPKTLLGLFTREWY